MEKQTLFAERKLKPKEVETKPQEASTAKNEIVTEIQPKHIEVNAFSSTAFKEPEVQETEIQEQTKESSQIIEKPNYDFIESLSAEEEAKVYKLEKEKAKPQPKKRLKKLRTALFSLVIAVCSIWGIYNVATITTLNNSIASLTATYELNLANYLFKLGTLDAASNYNDLFETYSVEQVPPAQVAKSSNWFDRICNFIAGIFGG